MGSNQSISIPLKWPGGKRWLAPSLVAILGDVVKYREPFFGGGSVYFALSPDHAHLSDTNKMLIETYSSLKSDPERVISLLARLRPINESRYNQVRRMVPRSEAGRAARMIYLNRTAFNGIYRVNQNGQFNVPFGRRPPTDLLTRDALRRTSAQLAKAKVFVADFRTSLKAAQIDEVIYCDPPYTVMHNNNGFLRYNERLFSWHDQVDLSKYVSSFADMGGKIIVSNAAHGPLEKLYTSRKLYRFHVRRRSLVAGKSSNRGWQSELLVISKACGTKTYLRQQLQKNQIVAIEM